MVKVILVNNEHCSLEELACVFGPNVEVAGRFLNLSEAMAQIREMKANAMFLNNDASDKERLKVVNTAIGRTSDNGVVFVLTSAQPNGKRIKELRIPAISANNETKAAHGNPIANKTEEMVHQYALRKKSERITLWENERIVLINAAKIACCFMQKGQRKVTVAVENKLYKSNDTLNAFIDKIGQSQLIRCHRSFALNPNYLLEMVPAENNTMVAKVAGYDREIPISRQYSPVLRSIAGLHIRADCKKIF
ncbi:LytTR family DNA-binding domain-containing protein [Sporomusa acidovorans]|uniref:HTH LytTR-type domain-containing protein n=1 Tax=Sporomusa acidovorans (strain ATCC 49682 / DSM 3132 / Mol) TaxID=1123286 RepID=A0ABZ3IYS7_SPOA4|nr:LytTR family DNA-binding domain-containing protein [Sporomusa acidovorans]OZC17229.1 transcriptional regulatory protein YpdB [Sporomusa acidovorans DSM 3132]SDF15217.1 two component transcriptional regulator, LytTR family [Sporomusa acidovorans]